MSGQSLVMASDGLPALVTGQWSLDKHDYIHRLADIFSTGIKDKSRFRCLIDLFAGPGRCVDGSTRKEFPGSPIQVIDVRNRFTHYFFNDINPANITALRTRIASLREPPAPTYFVGDCNTVISGIRKALPPARESLDLAIVDPWGWEINFDSIASLTQGRRMDLIVTFQVGLIKRNWNRPPEQLDRFLGGDGYKDAFLDAMEKDSGNGSRILLDHYEGRLKDIGYKFTNDKVWIHNTNQVKLYHLVFASRNPLGEDFWQKVTKRSRQGQYVML